VTKSGDGHASDAANRSGAITQTEDGSAKCAAYLKLMVKDDFPKIWVPN